MIRRLGAWLALTAIALNALWPVLARATPHGIAAEICSVNPSALRQSDIGRDEQPLTPFKVAAAHCPLCVSSAGTPMPAVAVVFSFLLPLLDAAGFAPSSSSPAAASSVIVLAAPPRAPPLS
jgi:hypothetical protein